MAITKTNTSDLKSHHIFGLIVGNSGSGKTHLAKTLNQDTTLILSMESGLLTLKGSNIDVWVIESMDDLREAFKELSEGTKYDTIFIDSLTELSEICFTTLEPNYTKAQTFGLYGDFKKQIVSIIKSFRDLTSYNVWVTCLTKEVEEGLSLDVTQKSLGQKVPSYFDQVFYLKAFRTDDGITQRALVSDNTLVEFCKSRSNNIEAYEKPNLLDITNKIMEKEN